MTRFKCPKLQIQLQIQATHAQGNTVPSINPIKIQEPNSRSERTTGGLFFRKLFRNLFYIHLFLVTILVLVLSIRGLIYAANDHQFHPQKWFPPPLASIACAAIVGLAWQSFTQYNPGRTIRAAFWLSPLLTCGFGILLVVIGSAGSSAAAVIALISAIVQSLYSCWVTPRFDHATRVLSVCTAFPPSKTTMLVILTIIACILYSSFLVAGIGGATTAGTGLDTLFILIILLSLTWTMHVIKNTLQVTVSRVKYMNFACGTDLDMNVAFRDALKHSLGSVCIGSALVPVYELIRGSARSMSLLSGDRNEFMFSCVNCYSGVASRLVTYGNRWGFVHVGVYNKGFVEASMKTWEMFRQVGLEPLIDSDLTGSFCFLCGVAGGAACALAGGSWALVIHKGYATEVSIYAFLTGYFMSRVAMAWPQACVSAYHVAYAEDPQSLRFDSTIPDRIQELQRSQVQPSRTTFYTETTDSVEF